MSKLTVVNVDGIIVRGEGTGEAVWTCCMMLANETARRMPDIERAISDVVIFGRGEFQC